MLIDTHAHLDYSDYDADRTEVLARARAAGVEEIISIGTRLDSSKRAVELAESIAGVWATVGVHPTEADSVAESSAWLDEIAALARKSRRVVAIGEIGFDFHHLPSAAMVNPQHEMIAAGVAQDPVSISGGIADSAYKNQQEIVFREQLDLAAELGLNVVIHQRDAWDDTMRVLEEYKGRVRGGWHCFGGTPEQAQEVLALGHLVSFTGIVTFKNAKIVHETANSVPANAFMVETDCPYLAPVPHRGQRCEPAHTALVAKQIATLRGVSVEEIATATTETARRFFRFDR